MRYFTALCSVQYDKLANNVILSEAEGSLKQLEKEISPIRSIGQLRELVILSEAEGSLKQLEKEISPVRSIGQLRKLVILSKVKNP